jgi:hypothetical protein
LERACLANDGAGKTYFGMGGAHDAAGIRPTIAARVAAYFLVAVPFRASWIFDPAAASGETEGNRRSKHYPTRDEGHGRVKSEFRAETATAIYPRNSSDRSGSVAMWLRARRQKGNSVASR